MTLYPQVSSKFKNCKIYGIYKGYILQYVGFTTNSIQLRFTQHFYEYKKSKIGMLMKVEGRHNFRIQLIEDWDCDTYDQIGYREQYWIQQLNPLLNIQRPEMRWYLPALPKSLPPEDDSPPPLPTTPIPTF